MTSDAISSRAQHDNVNTATALRILLGAFDRCELEIIRGAEATRRNFISSPPHNFSRTTSIIPHDILRPRDEKCH